MEEELCTTPKNQECQIQAPLECPPAPRKKKKNEKTTKTKKNIAYFHSRDLDSFFATSDRARVLVMNSVIQ